MKVQYWLLAIIFSLVGYAQTVTAEETVKNKVLGLELGAKLPELKVTTQYGQEVPLIAAEGNRWVFVFFYPKALTGGWTKQACSVQDVFEKLKEQKVSVFGISTDSVKKQLKFSNKEELGYTLVADTEKKVAKAFHVPLLLKKMTSRQAYLFKDGVLVWRDVKGATKAQGEEVLQAIGKNSSKKDS